jgi:hypothetical protein
MRSMLMIVAVVAVGIMLGTFQARAPMTASELDAVIPTETVFSTPQDIDWTGQVFGIFAGGEGLAVRQDGTDREFQAYMKPGVLSSVPYGPVRIKGAWTGISCAYANTVFSGHCTPTVDVTSVIPLK